MESLSSKQAQKTAWMLQLIEESEIIPSQYFKKLVNTDEIREVRIQFGRNIFRILGFFDANQAAVLNHAFQKKSQKTPRKEVKISENRKEDYLSRQQELMSDFQQYITKRRKIDAAFDEGFDEGYQAFKVGALLKQARKASWPDATGSRYQITYQEIGYFQNREPCRRYQVFDLGEVCFGVRAKA